MLPTPRFANRSRPERKDLRDRLTMVAHTGCNPAATLEGETAGHSIQLPLGAFRVTIPAVTRLSLTDRLVVGILRRGPLEPIACRAFGKALHLLSLVLASRLADLRSSDEPLVRSPRTPGPTLARCPPAKCPAAVACERRGGPRVRSARSVTRARQRDSTRHIRSLRNPWAHLGPALGGPGNASAPRRAQGPSPDGTLSSTATTTRLPSGRPCVPRHPSADLRMWSSTPSTPSPSLACPASV
jgi:hypothetical protein